MQQPDEWRSLKQWLGILLPLKPQQTESPHSKPNKPATS